MKFRFLVIVCVGALCVSAAFGQSNRWDIRLNSGKLLHGVVPDTLRGDTLIVGVKGLAHPVPLADITGIAPLTRDTAWASRMVRGVIVGSTLGLAATALASSLTDPNIGSSGSPDRASEFMHYAPVFILGGAFAGGIAALEIGQPHSANTHDLSDSSIQARRDEVEKLLALSGPRVPLRPERVEIPVRRPAGYPPRRTSAPPTGFFGSLGLGISIPVGDLANDAYGTSGKGPSFMGEIGYKFTPQAAWQSDLFFTINDDATGHARKWSLLWLLTGIHAGGELVRKIQCHTTAQVGLVHASMPGTLYEVSFLQYHDWYSGPSITRDDAAVALGAGICYDEVVSLDIRYHLGLGTYPSLLTSRNLKPQVLIVSAGFRL